MKILFLFVVLWLCIYEIHPQVELREANLEIPFRLRDNSNPPFSSQVLTVGLDSTATDAIDMHLGEYALLCTYHFFIKTDCPPVDIFKTLLELPLTGDFILSFKDFRFGILPYTGQKIHRVRYQMHSTATALNLDWNFPEGVSAVVQDLFGGIILNETLTDSGTFSFPPQYFSLGQFLIIMNYENAIPVELIAFNAVQSEEGINLNWETSTETNNYGFEIERANLNKLTTEIIWQKIGFVNGSGTTTEQNIYTFIDAAVSSGLYKYRLKQIDYDGTSTYSPEIEIEVKHFPADFVLYQNYPNPFNPGTKINFYISAPGYFKLNVYNITGEIVKSLADGLFAAGLHEVEFKPGNLSSGIYLYSLETAGSVKVKAMIFLK
ncbi:MAG: T9SS type A sorting domain-containing protein [Ignavibacteriales bacterium]|nr:MAG: T9SS type A sorting domain-containing protein [Ignavibacteriales bacterium]